MVMVLVLILAFVYRVMIVLPLFLFLLDGLEGFARALRYLLVKCAFYAEWDLVLGFGLSLWFIVDRIC